ncbi:hypothetical protein Dimus_001432, partial [Dionaea muscipula]
YSFLIHSEWDKLDTLSNKLTVFRIKHILLKILKDSVLLDDFYKWVVLKQPNAHTLETHSVILHILSRNRKFRCAESILEGIVESRDVNLPSRLFEAIVYSYREADSFPHVFNSLFKTYAHLKRCRNATDTFFLMKDYGFLPTIESCNVYLSSLLSLNQADIALAFY